MLLKARACSRATMVLSSRTVDGWAEEWADGWSEEWVDGWAACEGEGKGGVKGLSSRAE